jgi:glucose/arabinose dehydrogenase
MARRRGSLVLGGLSSRPLIRLTLDGAKVTGEERIDKQRRIRDVIQACAGALLVIADGELLRVTPASATNR